MLKRTSCHVPGDPLNSRRKTRTRIVICVRVGQLLFSRFEPVCFLGVFLTTMARGSLVDSTVTPYYHCISRCVRRARLCGDGCEHRKQWIEDRLQELAAVFAVEVAG